MIDTLVRRTSSFRFNVTLPDRRRLVLLVLLGAVLMMPVSYRAGTDQANVHTIFQSMIDAVVGHQHAHGDQHEQVTVPSPFSPPGIPLSTTDGHHTTPVTGAESDVPQQVQFAGPALALTALLGLGALVAALLSTSGNRPLWVFSPRLTPADLSLEPPPPRQAIPF